METAEMWIQHGMGEITGSTQGATAPNNLQYVSPITKCDEGFVVVYVLEAKKYSCILEDTAKEWTEHGIAEFHDPEEYIMKSIETKNALVKIEEINQQIRDMEKQLEYQKLELKKTYNAKYDKVELESREAEKKMTRVQ